MRANEKDDKKMAMACFTQIGELFICKSYIIFNKLQ